MDNNYSQYKFYQVYINNNRVLSFMTYDELYKYVNIEKLKFEFILFLSTKYLHEKRFWRLVFL